MSEPVNWETVAHALNQRAIAGRPVRFWLRDDDAVAPSAALDRLLALTSDYVVPVTLAVIPEKTDGGLARRLKGENAVQIAVHGWSHRNHAPAGFKNQELGPHRPTAQIVSELGTGLAKLRLLHGDRLLPMLVPPWNRIDPSLLPALPGLGFSVLSVFGKERPSALAVINTHIDPIDWHGARALRNESVLVAELVREIERNGPWIGVLTHHLAHHKAVWGFLERLFEVTCGHRACRWVTASTLVEELTPR